jgi:hypothetical protein
MKKKYTVSRRFLCLWIITILLAACLLESHAREAGQLPESAGGRGYEWTTDHMQVGVRWQPFAGFPANNAYDAKRPVITRESGYAQFWVNWAAVEPEKKTPTIPATCRPSCAPSSRPWTPVSQTG